MYGFTGATVGQLPCLPIASSVTSYGKNSYSFNTFKREFERWNDNLATLHFNFLGRQLLEKTKEFVESNYNIAHGYKYDSQVVSICD